MGYRMVTGF